MKAKKVPSFKYKDCISCRICVQACPVSAIELTYKGKRYSSIYETPYGAIGLEVFTKEVANNLDMEKGEGIIDVLYQISIEGVAEGENRITIKVN